MVWEVRIGQARKLLWVFRLSTGSRASAMSHLPSGNRRHWDGNTNGADSQSRRSSSLHSAARTPTNARARLHASSPSKKQRNNTDLPTSRRIRRLPGPRSNWLPHAQRAVWIAPAQCVEQIVVASPGYRTQPTNLSSPGEDVPFPDDCQSMITTYEDGTAGCCTFFG
ncbi:hypothetical protein EDC04DRAFT_1215932 [Pisolithus marmoratus]|nr:hypothetical protein EDC04DRAFT_1215932 [Pisolithus marmoratus]